MDYGNLMGLACLVVGVACLMWAAWMMGGFEDPNEEYGP